MKHCILALFLIAAIGCTIGTPPPNEEQMRRNLLRQHFTVDAGEVDGGQHYTADVEVVNVKEFIIQERFTDKKNGTDEVHALVTLDDSTTTIKGVLVLGYKEFDQGWKLESIEDKGFTTINKECRPGVECNWSQAMDYCKNIGSRLPTKAELVRIYKSECSGRTGISGNCSGSYWSTDPYAPDFDRVWRVHFDDGSVYNNGRALNGYVRCVRAGP